MADIQYRDPADGVFKDALDAPAGPPGPAGAAGPAGPGGGAAPLGSIMVYVGTTAPTGWHFCDGTAHGSSTLQTLLGSANTPDLREKFIVGAGNTYAVKSTGGAATVTLTAAQSGLVGHTHTAGGDAHVHTVSPPATASSSALGVHKHPITGYYFTYTAANSTKTSDSGDNNYHALTGYTAGTGTTSIAHTHTANVAADATAAAAPAVTIAAAAAANATAAHENLPPFYALAYIIRKV